MSDNALDISLRRQLGEFRLQLDASLALDGVTAIFGASGAGKSALLRLIAGFDRPDSGYIRWRSTTWHDSSTGSHVAPHLRPVGYMFQDARLFPHLDTAGNLDFAHRRADPDGSAIERDDVIDALDLEDLLKRRPDTLSGGERQRVALARTLLVRPRLLLLDEPLSALDTGRKADILPYLQHALSRFGLPALYVSHSVDEIAALADRALVLQDGGVIAQGEVADVLERLDRDTGGVFDASVLVKAVLGEADAQRQIQTATLAGQSLSLPLLQSLEAGQTVRLRIRARDVAVATQRPQGISVRNILEGRISEIREAEASAFADLRIEIGDSHLRARITRASVSDLGLESGQTVFALVRSVSFESRLD